MRHRAAPCFIIIPHNAVDETARCGIVGPSNRGHPMATKHINPGHKRKATVNFDLLRATLDQLADMIAERATELKQRNDKLSAAADELKQCMERSER
jgi:hypothetical protein